LSAAAGSLRIAQSRVSLPATGGTGHTPWRADPESNGTGTRPVDEIVTLKGGHVYRQAAE